MLLQPTSPERKPFTMPGFPFLKKTKVGILCTSNSPNYDYFIWIFRKELFKTCNAYLQGEKRDLVLDNLRKIRKVIKPKIKHAYLYGDLGSKNQFFRDIVSELYNVEVNKMDSSMFEPLMIIWDKSISPAENQAVSFNFYELIQKAMEVLKEKYDNLPDVIEETSVNFDAEINLLKGKFNQVSDSLREHILKIAQLEFNITNMKDSS